MPNRDICNRCRGSKRHIHSSIDGDVMRCKATIEYIDLKGPPPAACPYWLEHIMAPSERDIKMPVVSYEE